MFSYKQLIDFQVKQTHKRPKSDSNNYQVSSLLYSVLYTFKKKLIQGRDGLGFSRIYFNNDINDDKNSPIQQHLFGYK